MRNERHDSVSTVMGGEMRSCFAMWLSGEILMVSMWSMAEAAGTGIII